MNFLVNSLRLHLLRLLVSEARGNFLRMGLAEFPCQLLRRVMGETHIPSCHKKQNRFLTSRMDYQFPSLVRRSRTVGTLSQGPGLGYSDVGAKPDHQFNPLGREFRPGGFDAIDMFHGAKHCPIQASPRLYQTTPGPFCVASS